MTNAWSLLYDEIYGDDEMTDKKEDYEHDSSWYDYTRNDPDAKNPFTDAFDYYMAESVVNGGGTGGFPYDYDTLNLNIHANSPYNDGWTRQAAQEELDKKMAEEPSIKNPCNRKYNEDQSIEALKEYVSSTYGGHYTSDNNNVQTLDLIESVGDAEAFCRSNAIKYLSRYDKKGQAKRDILKALHYSLLLYHFSGQLNETPTRGYETF